MTRVSTWTRWCLVIAFIKILFGGAGYFFGHPAQDVAPPTPFPDALLFLHVVLFTAAACLLFFAGSKDTRAIHLGGVFLLIASAYADRFVFKLSESGELWHVALAPWTYIFPNAFLPALMWLFIRDFPHTTVSGRALRVFKTALVASVVSSSIFFAGNLGIGLNRFYGSAQWRQILSLLARSGSGSYYWITVLGLVLAALPFAMWKARAAGVQERRRVQLFVGSMTIGIAPLLLQLVLELLIPPFRRLMDLPANRQLFALVLYPFFLSIPFTATYSVFVHRVLNIELIIRQAIRYLLARYSVITASVVPFAALGIYVFGHRSETITQLFSGGRVLVLLAAAALGIVLLGLRQRILNAIDRIFFREQYDSHRILADLVDRSRSAEDIRELATLLNTEIDKAMHLETVFIMINDLSHGCLISPDPLRALPQLSTSSSLVNLIERSSEPLEIDLDNAKSPVARLAIEDKQWLADMGCQLIVPLIGSDGMLVGCLALGSKRSELPFSLDDRVLLSAIANSAALTFENRMIRSSPIVSASTPPTSASGFDPTVLKDEVATSCLGCGLLNPANRTSCASCGAEVQKAGVPYILNGKFRFEYRVGSGGMGVVYRATDISLGRRVAIKTLPKVSPEHAVRLRREARAAASVAHPNLAFILGVETWRGTPMLVFEYLDGGTLADRLSNGKLTIRETVDIGITLADVLDHAHAVGILHRDIKPSNIGYTKDRVLKLLDFGLARIIDDSRSDSPIPTTSRKQTATVPAAFFEFQTSSGVLGTPCYLSPEALSRKSPDVSFDLWSLAIVLYECAAGKNPLLCATLRETLDRISRASVPDVRTESPGCPESFALFMSSALAADARRRPATAAEFKKQLESVKTSIGA